VTPRPMLHWMPRVKGDIKRCLDFVGRQPWGKPDDREFDIYRGMEMACAYPKANHPELRRRNTGIWLRRCNAAQFVVVYAYLPSRDPDLPSVVSIRAVLHSPVGDFPVDIEDPSAYSNSRALAHSAHNLFQLTRKRHQSREFHGNSI
jgi:hypothetical protein